MEIIRVIACSLLGALVSSLFSCLPGFHVYGLIALCVVLVTSLGPVAPDLLISFCAGMVTAYAVVGAVPSILMSAPDESAFFAALPGRKYLRRGRGYEAVMLMAVGAMAGIAWVIIMVTIAAPLALSALVSVLRPHMHWIVWCVICFMLLSEWPTGGRYAYRTGARLAGAWGQLLAGIITFLLSGILGLILFSYSPIGVGSAFQNLMPACAGLFTLPWLLLNLVGADPFPAQEFKMNSISKEQVFRGASAGVMGGSFSAVVPAITGGVGGFLAGHAAALRDDKVFLISQGASRAVYLVGSFVLFFVPAVSLTRGGAVWLVKSVYQPSSFHDYWLVLAAVGLSAGFVLLLLGPLARIAIRVIVSAGQKSASIGGVVLVIMLVLAFTRLEGLLVMLTAAGIGVIPALYGSRRMNCLGVILLPVALLL